MKEETKTELRRTCGPLDVAAVFVAHVSHGYEDRDAHMRSMMERLGIPFEYMLRGDIADLTPAVLDRYFAGGVMHRPAAATSCAMKHILICREIVERDLPGALVMEDDIVLRRRFIEVFNRSMAELPQWDKGGTQPVVVSYEDTRLRFVERSRRRPGVVLYEGDRDRMTGCYYINSAAARLYVDYAVTHKFDEPADITYNTLLRRGGLVYLWCHPTIASQGSHDGSMRSSISDIGCMTRWIRWQFKLNYRRLLYNMR